MSGGQGVRPCTAGCVQRDEGHLWHVRLTLWAALPGIVCNRPPGLSTRSVFVLSAASQTRKKSGPMWQRALGSRPIVVAACVNQSVS